MPRPTGGVVPERWTSRTRGLDALERVLSAERQPHLNPGVAGSRLDPDRAAVPLDDDPAGDIEAESGSPPDSLVVKKCSNAGRQPGRHARAGVADLDQYLPAVGAGADPQRTGSVHGVQSIVDQVGPHLVQLARVALPVREDRTRSRAAR